MPNITITFSYPINVSVQKGDTAYYLDNIQSAGGHNHSKQNDIIQIGNIVSINRNTNKIVCNWNPSPSNSLYPPNESYIMFSKDNKANLSSLLGYYAEIKFINNAFDEAELFSVGSETFGSSK